MTGKGVRIAAFIPARGGSKGLPRKNIRLMCGKPLIAWSIEAAMASQKVTDIIVTTDDSEIADIAKNYPVSILKRPSDLASDTAQNHDVVLHALECLDFTPDITVLLQPTSPLRQGHDIDACITLLDDSAISCALSVCECEHHPAKALYIDSAMHITPFTTWEDAEARRQTLALIYRQNGAVYAIRTNIFTKERRFLTPPAAAYIMPPERSVDIDTAFDLLHAEHLLTKAPA